MKLNRITTQLAASALLLMLPLGVGAAGLGKLTVNSALGQPLSAEIELLAVDKAELDSLNASLASGQAFKDAQIEYASVLSSLRFAIDKRADGRPVLKVTSTRPVDDPFLDMLIELNWASGRLVREYTVLLDPPGIAAPQTVSPIVVSAPIVQAPKPTAAAEAPKTEPVAVAKPAVMPEKPVARAEAKTEPKPDAKKPAEAARQGAGEEPSLQQDKKPVVAAASGATTITVKRGQTLSGIARSVKPADISLDQALVSLFRENQSAFDGKNMNRLKAGKTLSIPSADAMASIGPRAASREVRLQASDWHAYRTRLADRVAATSAAEPAEAGQVSVGKITPKVEDKAKPAEEAKDVLKLSKGAAPSAAATPAGKEAEATKKAAAVEEKIKAQEDLAAREKAVKESADRVASLEKQIQDMQDLVQMSEPAKEGAAQPPAAVPAPKIAAKPPVEQPRANWYDPILENPLYWGGGLAALGLGGILWWMLTGSRRRKSSTQQFEDSLMASQGLSPNTMIGAASGGAVNTGDTSFLTDFSQAGLGTIDTHDVDPIAEAEVYMAYGRDAQAEEILKEALGKSPGRHEIRVKLLEIYAARKNTAAFETVAKDLQGTLGGRHSDIWERVAEMGRAIDPDNPLYKGAASRDDRSPVTPSEAGAVIAGAMGAAAAGTSEARPVVEATEPAIVIPPEIETPQAFETPGEVLDFETPEPEVGVGAQQASRGTGSDMEKAAGDVLEDAVAASREEFDQGLEFDLSGLDIKVPEEDDTDFNMDEVEALSSDGKMDFSGLDLNLDEVGGSDAMDEVATKLDLARAYLEMGDKEGAREILQEVLNEGTDKQQSDARSIMAGL